MFKKIFLKKNSKKFFKKNFGKKIWKFQKNSKEKKFSNFFLKILQKWWRRLETLPKYNNNNSQIIPAYAGCGEIETLPKWGNQIPLKWGNLMPLGIKSHTFKNPTKHKTWELDTQKYQVPF